MVLVALDKSHIEKAFMDDDKRALNAFQLDAIIFPGEENAVLPHHQRSTSPIARPEVLVTFIDGGGPDDSASDDVYSAETSTYTDTSVGRKPEDTV